MAPGSFVDLLVNATDKATGESLSDLERTNQAFVMVMSGVTQPTGEASVTWSSSANLWIASPIFCRSTSGHGVDYPVNSSEVDLSASKQADICGWMRSL